MAKKTANTKKEIKEKKEKDLKSKTVKNNVKAKSDKKVKVIKEKNEIVVTNNAPKRSTRTKEKIDYSAVNMEIEEDSSKFSSPMLASNYDCAQDITNWYMSEKLDGIRCIWDGKTMRSRNGNKFYPPEFFTVDFPKDVMLDGELFLDRKKFSETVSIVKKQEAHDGWKKIKYLVFDGPELKGNFKNRLKLLGETLGGIKSPYIELHKHEICTGTEQLEKSMKEIVSIGGEGVILRDPSSPYENRRTKTMLKVKEFHDAEATVTGHIKGTGRLTSLMGAIEVKNKEGIVFRIGSGFTDKERSKPPKIGSVVTYRYFELSKDNVPRFPTFLRVHPGL